MADIKNIKDAPTTIGMVSGPYQTELMVCQQMGHLITSPGLWISDPFNSTLPVFMFQISFIFFVTQILLIFLKPLRMNFLLGYILAGIIIGPAVFGQNETYFAKVFPPGGIVILMTLADVGFMFHLFTVGVQVDFDLLTKTGKSAAFIGSMCFLLPYALGFLTFTMLNNHGSFEANWKQSMPFVILINSVSSLPVITSLLADLRILNSEVGRMATHVSMVCDIWSWTTSLVATSINLAFRNNKMESIWSVVLAILFIVVITLIGRPLLKRSNSYPKEDEKQEAQFYLLLVVLLCFGFLSEILGQHSGFGALLLGLALPDGPPLGTTLVQKLETVPNALLVPSFLATSGLRVKFAGMSGMLSVFTELVIMAGYLGKFCGTILAAVCCGMSFWDAIPLGLIMCCKGVIEVSLYIVWHDRKIIPSQVYSQLLLTMLIVTTLARPIIIYMYDPSRRYMFQGRRNLQEGKEGVKMQFLVCLHDEDHVPTIMNLLEASHPTPHNPLTVFVLHLRELKGSSTSVLVPHHHHHHHHRHHHHKAAPKATKATSYDHIVNVFQYYEEQNCGNVIVQHFTAIAPYATIHNDVCFLASDKRTNLVIMPFHKTWAIDGSMGSTNRAIQITNKNVLNKAPCSVGLLIDRGPLTSNQYMMMSELEPYRIVMLFLGGADDREALTYCMRMAEHPKVDLTIARVKNDDYLNAEESNIDQELIDRFQATVGKRKVKYIEETAVDGVGTTQLIRSYEDAVDMLIVGKHHDPLSPLIMGLTEWSEFPELGVIGDMLATSDFQFSVLVVQREPLVSRQPHLSSKWSGSQLHSCSSP